MKQGDNIKKLNIDWKSIGPDKWLLLALAGVILIICSIPSSGGAKNKKEKTIVNTETSSISGNDYVSYMEKRLEELLVNVAGIGRVKVMITLKDSGQKVVLKEEPYTRNTTKEEDAEGGVRNVDQISEEQRVIYITDSAGNTVPYVIQEKEPEIEGIAIAAEGGGDRGKAAEITGVAEALFSVSPHKISVIEMNE